MPVTVTDYARALRSTLGRRSLKDAARGPLERHATALIGALPAVDLSRLTGAVTFDARVLPVDARHAWSLHAPDQLVLQAIIAGRSVRTAFEIGTFNGGTTRLIAEALPEDGRIWTLDLPPQSFDDTQKPQGFQGSQVGAAYRGSPAEAKIEQILADSATFDPTPYTGRCDLVLVDGAHDYEHGVADTITAFELVAPGGLILWDDFQPYWHGLIRGIIEAAGARRPRRLAGTSLGVWTAELDG
ncbi:class I SAM-dependent methyltransferase [Humibacter sp.]|uniref:O-methyltransferase n=1 Tax=Humibacter sp. TaxID=1940291 RepID=UPI002D01148A|nr:class I SAM-dependent methyltransferase [Humibacter sp.]HVX07913.1 class I SAM-dependent methyltransferase [Humibacter sp.]